MLTKKSAYGLLVSLSVIAGLASYRWLYKPGTAPDSEGEASSTLGAGTCADDGQLPTPESSPALITAESSTSCNDSLPEEAPSAEALLFNSALSLIKQGQTADALARLDQLLNKQPAHLGALVETAMIYQLDRSEPRKALPYYQRAFALHSESHSLLSEIVGIYAELGDMRRGLAYLKELASEHPQQGHIALAIGKILVSNGLMQEAIPYLEVASQEDRYDLILGDLAYAYSKTGEKEKARRTFQEAVRQEQNNYKEGLYKSSEEEGRRNLMTVYLNYASELFLQNDKEKAASIIKDKVLKINSLAFQDLDEVF